MRVNAFEIARDEETCLEQGLVFIRESKSGNARHVALTDEGRVYFASLTAGRSRGELMFGREAVAKQPTRDRSAEMQRVGLKNSDQSRAMAAACKAGGIAPAVSFHVPRHTYASRLAKHGAGLQVIVAQLGHSGVAMAERHYTHLAPNYVAAEVRARFGTIGIGAVQSAEIPLARRLNA